MAVDTMNIALFHDGSELGKQVIDAWPTKLSRTTEFELVYDGSLDEVEKLRPRLVLLASDRASEFEQLVLQKCRDLNLGVLCVLGRGSTVLVGPLETPGVPGCVTCLQLRFENTFERSLMNAFLAPQDDGVGEPLEMLASDLVKLGDILLEEIESILSGAPDFPKSRGQIGVYEQGEGIEWVPLVPSHDCPRCNLMPDDSPALAELPMASHNIREVETLRVGTVEFKRLERLFVHAKVGYISAVNHRSAGDRYVQADASIYTPAGADIVGYGSGMSVTSAQQSAVLEVLERSCGFQAANRRPVVWGKVSDFENVAVHPTQFGLHRDELFSSSHPNLEPFDEGKRYSWVWAHSTKNHKAVLIPEQIAYYGPTADEKRFITETSNGCALGGTVEEAVLHGIFEVLERDGLLNMWYGRIPVPEFRLDSRCPSKVSKALQYLTQRGFEVRLFTISHDLGIPAIFAVAIRGENCYPKVVSGSACHLNPSEAVYGALRELTVQVVNLQQAAEERREEALSMFLDPTRIRNILDHVAVSSLPEAYPRWGFLLQQESRGRVQTVEEAYPGVNERYQIDTRDIRAILCSVLDDLHDRGFDVIVVDQTSAEVACGGLHAVKVLIPGMTPVTFGYGFQRVRGLQRLFELPYRLGSCPRVLTERELNPNCHPLS